MTKTRVLAALVMAPLAIAAILLLPTPWLALLAAVVFLGGLWEWLRLAEVEDTLARTVLLVLNLVLMVAMVWASRTASGGSLVLLQVAAMVGVGWWLLAALWLRAYDFGSDHDSGARVAKLAAGTLAVIPAWCALVLIHAQSPNGHIWLLVALLIVWAADTGAYFAGRKFGRHKLSPRISPNKTIEGLAGGALAGVLVGVVGGVVAGTATAKLPAVALVALAVVLASAVGDLFESLLKRHAGVKDSGDLIPGHGGLLDRMDSVLAALPVFVLGKEWLGF
jgi:phosphatidate cytidylyltransferase